MSIVPSDTWLEDTVYSYRKYLHIGKMDEVASLESCQFLKIILATISFKLDFLYFFLLKCIVLC